jgi:hypothetical protein
MLVKTYRFFNQLSGGVTCDRRRLAVRLSVGDATPAIASSKGQDEVVLGYGCERKEIIDLVNGLNAKNKSTGACMTNFVPEKLKMNNEWCRRQGLYC